MDIRLIYNKGDTLYCQSCGAHIFTISRDLYMHDRLDSSIFEESQGQGPWLNGEVGACRKCKAQFLNSSKLFIGNWEPTSVKFILSL